MNIALKTLSPRLFAGVGALTLLAGVGLIASRPAHSGGGPIAVNVANTPLAVTVAGDTAAKQPFVASTVYRFQDTATLAKVDTADGFAGIPVPAGKRLIVQTVGVTADGGSGHSRFQASIAATVNGQDEYFPLPIVSDFGVLYAGTTQAVDLSVDGSSIGFRIRRANPVDTQYIQVAVYGYLVDMP